jgi:hypothetical protein
MTTSAESVESPKPGQVWRYENSDVQWALWEFKSRERTEGGFEYWHADRIESSSSPFHESPIRWKVRWWPQRSADGVWIPLSRRVCGNCEAENPDSSDYLCPKCRASISESV